MKNLTKKYCIAAFLWLLAMPALLAQTPPEWQWAKRAGGSSSDYGHNVTVDDEGNSYVTGNFVGILSLGNVILTSSGDSDVFIIKYDTNGNVIWAKKAGGSASDYGNGIAVDASGNSYITGSFSNTASFGNINLTTSFRNNVFVAKYDANGNAIWAKTVEGSIAEAGGGDIAIDAAGNVYVTGDNSSVFIDISTAISTLNNRFVAKYDTNGNLIWAKKTGGGVGIATDGSGNSYVTGTFLGTVTVGGNTLVSNGNSPSIFVVKYNTLGNVVWVKKTNGIVDILVRDISVDASGNSYIIGNFSESVVFEGINLTSNGEHDVFILKYDTSGNTIWARKTGGNGDDKGHGITVDISGNIYATGFFNRVAKFGNIELTGTNTYDAFVAKYDTNGNIQWAKKTVLEGNDNWGNDIAVDVYGNSYIVGGVIPTNSGAISRNNVDILVAKLSSSCERPSAPIISGIDSFCSGGNTTLNISNPATNATYLWSNGAIGNTITVTSLGSYSARTIVNGCASPVSNVIQVTVIPPPSTPVISGANTFCPKSSATLNISNPTPNTTYVWNNGATGNSIAVNAVGNFSVKAIDNASSCESATSNTWSVSEFAPTFPPDTMLMKDENIFLTASGGSIYLWTPATGLSANNVANPVASPTQTTTYTLTISNGQGCAETRNVTVNVVEIFVPNMFSPNGDGQNDVLKVYGNDLAEYELLLFNRLGNEVGRIDQTAAFSSWNGEYQGKILAGETLVWTLRGKTSNGTPFTRKGSVLVMK